MVLQGIGNSALSPSIFSMIFKREGAFVSRTHTHTNSNEYGGVETNVEGCKGLTCRSRYESIIPFGWVRRWSVGVVAPGMPAGGGG